MKDLRRTVVATVIGSFSLAALMGILALLGAGSFGEAGVRSGDRRLVADTPGNADRRRI